MTKVMPEKYKLFVKPIPKSTVVVVVVYSVNVSKYHYIESQNNLEKPPNLHDSSIESCRV